MALESSPNQDGQAFAWWRPRLKNGVKSVSEETLDQAIATLEDVEFFFANLVVTGVALEFVLAYLHPAYNSHLARYGSLLCDAYVALGIVGEVAAGMRMRLCEGELTRRSKKELGEANDRLAQVEFESGFAQERAAKAEQETERLKALTAWREVTPEQVVALKFALDGQTFEIVIVSMERGNPELFGYASDLQRTLSECGLRPSISESNSISKGGVGPLFGIAIVGQDVSARDILRSAFEIAQIPTVPDPFGGTIAMGRVTIWVGAKPKAL